jgi:hypothetical protein
VFEEVKQRPLYVVSKLLNFDAAAAAPSIPPRASAGNWVAVSGVYTSASDPSKLSESAAE